MHSVPNEHRTVPLLYKFKYAQSPKVYTRKKHQRIDHYCWFCPPDCPPKANGLLPFPAPAPLLKPNALGVGVDGLPNTDCGCVGPLEVPDKGSPNADFWNPNACVNELVTPDEEGAVASSFFPKEKAGEVFDGAPKVDDFKLSAGLADPLPNDEVLGWVLPNATGDPAGVVEKGLFDMLLPNVLLGVGVDMLASGALDFPKILFEAPFVPKLELPNTDAGAGAAALLASSLAVFAAPKIDNGASFFVSPPDAAVANADVPDCGPKANVDLDADEAPVEPNAELPEGLNENLGFSVSGAMVLGASEVSAGFDAAVVLPPPNTDVDDG